MAEVAAQQGTEATLGGPAATTLEVVPNTGATAESIKRDFEANRRARGLKTVRAVLGADGSTPAASGTPTPQPGARELAPPGAGATEGEEPATAPPLATHEDHGTSGTGAEPSRLERVEAASKKARDDAKRARQRQADVRKLEAERAQSQAQLHGLRQQAQRGQNLEQQLRQDPLAAFKSLGITEEQLVQRALQAGSPEEKIAALERVIASERNERIRMQEAQRQREAEAGYKAAQESFWKLSQNADKYPHLVGHPREALLAMAKSVAHEAKLRYMKEIGAVPEGALTDKRILRYLDSLYERSETKAGATGSKATTTPGKSATPASTKAGQPRTLSNGLAVGAARSSGDKLSRNERIKALKGQIRQ